METSEIAVESRVILFYESDESKRAQELSGSPHVIDLAVREELKTMTLEVVFASGEAVIARAREVGDGFSLTAQASLVYPLFSESWRVPVRISLVTDLGPNVYSFRPLEEWEYLNRRSFVRVHSVFPVTLVPNPLSSPLGVSCMSKDISNSGIGLELPAGFAGEIADEVKLKMHRHDGELDVTTEVASRRGDILGLSFHKLGDSAEKRIGRVVFQAQIAKKRLLLDD